MLKADKYIKETLEELKRYGVKDLNPRPKYADGTPAHTYFLPQKMFSYNIAAGELPLTTLRKTALKGAYFDVEAIYIKQTNILEEMHPSIKSWWKSFCKPIHLNILYNIALKQMIKTLPGFDGENLYKDESIVSHSLGATYGNTVKRYDLMNKLLKGLEENPFGRRHSINMNQEQQKIDDPSALQPCAFETMWSIMEIDYVEAYNNVIEKIDGLMDIENFDREEGSYKVRFIDLTLIQRSMDYLVTMSINPIQYVMFGMMVCNHLSFKTGIKHSLGNFSHFVQNLHVYDRHFWALEEMLERKPSGNTPTLKLNCEPKDFYSHTWEDFSWGGLEDIKPLSKKLEIAV